MANSFVFSSESVGEGHPDKVADYISDSILDACLKFDPKARVACETFVKSNIVVIGGEITLPKLQDKRTGRTRPLDDAFNVDKVIRDAIREIGYVNDDDVFHADTVFITNLLDEEAWQTGSRLTDFCSPTQFAYFTAKHGVAVSPLDKREFCARISWRF